MHGLGLSAIKRLVSSKRSTDRPSVARELEQGDEQLDVEFALKFHSQSREWPGTVAQSTHAPSSDGLASLFGFIKTNNVYYLIRNCTVRRENAHLRNVELRF